MDATIDAICKRYDDEAGRLLDILWGVQDHFRCISPEALGQIARRTGLPRVEVEGVATFYAYFSTTPLGRVTIRLCEDIVDRHSGMFEVEQAFSEVLQLAPGETTVDEAFSLLRAPCIGLSDQGPAALINDIPFTRLTPARARKIARQLKAGADPSSLVTKTGDGNNSAPRIASMVTNNVRYRGPMLLDNIPRDAGLKKAHLLSSAEIIQLIRDAGLRGRGGAGFQTGLKWRIAAKTRAPARYVICNADEGEPGTFKDRVLLTERPHLLFEGMTICARAINSHQGILYLRAEYRYLQPWLESILAERRDLGLLGEAIGFDIRIQRGAGAYICGEESSLIRSCEGKRGEPANRPPYPVQSGYQCMPTVVNNVETFCQVPRILAEGPNWFRSMGTELSSGTKLFSISGDCKKPGIYELPYGVTLRELLERSGATDVAAVQVGGASGVMVAAEDFDRQLSFEDLSTAGSMMVFSAHRNILEIVDYFLHFFIEESCGYCTPCRVGNVFLKQGIEKVLQGQAEASDLDELERLGQTIIATSRCGLGHTSPNPVLSTLKSFPLVYTALLHPRKDGRQAGFNIQTALEEARHIARRRSRIYDTDYTRPEGGGG